MSQTLSPELTRMVAALSPGDMSTIEAAAREPGAVILTTRGSPNDAICSRLAAEGWTRAETPEIDLPPGAGIEFVGWSITEEGKAPVLALVEAAVANVLTERDGNSPTHH